MNLTSIEKGRKTISQKNVLERLRAQLKKPNGLRTRELLKVGIYSSMLRHFESKTNALKALGMSDDQIIKLKSCKVAHKWNPVKVLSALEKLRAKHGTLEGQNFAKNQTSLYTAAIRYFGSWESAVQKAKNGNKHNYRPMINIYWTPHRLKSYLASLLELYGTPYEVPSDKKKEVKKACRIHYGSEQKAFLVAHQERKRRWLKSLLSSPTNGS